MSPRLPVVAFAAFVLVLLVAGCAAPPERPQPPAAPPTLDRAIEFASDDLFIQMLRLPETAPPRLGGTPPPIAVVVDSMIDGVSGQQTHATEFMQQRLAERVRQRFPQFDVRPASPTTVPGARFLLTGTITRAPEAGETARYRLNLSLTELRSALVVAQSGTAVRDPTVDATPTAFYRDTPTTTRDRIVDGYIATAKTPAGQPADAVYVEHISTLALVNAAQEAYNAGRYDAAHALYEAAAARPDGDQLRVLNGLYLTRDRLGLQTEAEAAFDRVVALGLAANNLGIRILFRPGTTDYIGDAQLTRPYPMWLRSIARSAVKTRICLLVVGHTSHTGSEPYNDRLSQQRAQSIKRRLEQESPELATRIQASGVGWRENIVGTGTDDMTDALDRRVEFRRQEC